MESNKEHVDEDGVEDIDDEESVPNYGNTKRSARDVRNFERNVSKMNRREEIFQSSAKEMNLEEMSGLSKIPGSALSGRQTVLRSYANSRSRLSSDSDLDESDLDEKTKFPGEYDDKQFEHLEVGPEIKEVFQYIIKYIPQQMSLDHKFKPFVPEFLPAVGDIDAFLKIIPPKKLVGGGSFVSDQQLGLIVLDEPASNQSDAALLHLQLRAESVNTAPDSNVVVKKIDNIEKNAKIIDKWIKDIAALHKSKSFPTVRYTEPMPDLDELMEEWPEDMEQQLKENTFPEPNGTLDEYIDQICGIFKIPVKNRIQSLHLLFSLYAAVKSSQLFKSAQLQKSDVNSTGSKEKLTDQLVLE